MYYSQIGSRSSVYSPESRVRKTGSFIYEDFMPTDGTDVKVSVIKVVLSTVGERYIRTLKLVTSDNLCMILGGFLIVTSRFCCDNFLTRM